MAHRRVLSRSYVRLSTLSLSSWMTAVVPAKRVWGLNWPGELWELTVWTLKISNRTCFSKDLEVLLLIASFVGLAKRGLGICRGYTGAWRMDTNLRKGTASVCTSWMHECHFDGGWLNESQTQGPSILQKTRDQKGQWTQPRTMAVSRWRTGIIFMTLHSTASRGWKVAMNHQLLEAGTIRAFTIDRGVSSSYGKMESWLCLFTLDILPKCTRK